MLIKEDWDVKAEAIKEDGHDGVSIQIRVGIIGDNEPAVLNDIRDTSKRGVKLAEKALMRYVHEGNDVNSDLGRALVLTQVVSGAIDQILTPVILIYNRLNDKQRTKFLDNVNDTCYTMLNCLKDEMSEHKEELEALADADDDDIRDTIKKSIMDALGITEEQISEVRSPEDLLNAMSKIRKRMEDENEKEKAPETTH